MFVAKIVLFGLKLFGRNASYLPGLIAIKLCPNFLEQIGKPEKIIAVTGTNGKTTCCNLLIDNKSLLTKTLLLSDSLILHLYC